MTIAIIASSTTQTQPPSEDPAIAAAAAWHKAEDTFKCDDDPEYNGEVDRLHDAEIALIATPATTLAGIAFKLTVFLRIRGEYGEAGKPDDDGDRDILLSIAHDLDRLTGGATAGRWHLGSAGDEVLYPIIPLAGTFVPAPPPQPATPPVPADPIV